GEEGLMSLWETGEAGRLPVRGGGERGRGGRAGVRVVSAGERRTPVCRTTGGPSTRRDGPFSRDRERGGATAAAHEPPPLSPFGRALTDKRPLVIRRIFDPMQPLVDKLWRWTLSPPGG